MQKKNLTTYYLYYYIWWNEILPHYEFEFLKECRRPQVLRVSFPTLL